MNTVILTLRISRRAIGAAALVRDELTLLDGRFLNSRPERTVPAALRYVLKLVDLVKPAYVVLDAPGADNGATLSAALVEAITPALGFDLTVQWLLRYQPEAKGGDEKPVFNARRNIKEIRDSGLRKDWEFGRPKLLKRLRRRPGKLQIQMVASPRNQKSEGPRTASCSAALFVFGCGGGI